MPKRIAILGLTVSGNRGAESMLLSIMDGMREKLGACDFDLLTVYPREDSVQPCPPGLRIVSAKPLAMLVLILPIAVLVGRFCHRPLAQRLLGYISALESLLAADLVLDSSGVTFIDNRGLLRLLYNTALALSPALLGRPTVKLAQAMGPFETKLNRVIARFVLSRLDCVIARGDITEMYLRQLKLRNVAGCADTAFAMRIDDAARVEARAVLSVVRRDVRLVGISPSTVVESYCTSRGIDYASLMAAFIRDLKTQDYRAVLIPHSLRPNSSHRMNNDALVCRDIRTRLPRDFPVYYLEQELRAPVLRAVIGSMSFYVASRFHAMISALTMAVPLLVVGWSHKYREVMAMFQLEQQVMGFEELTAESFYGRFRDLEEQQDEVRAKIASHLPEVIAHAKRNFTLAAAVFERRKS